MRWSYICNSTSLFDGTVVDWTSYFLPKFEKVDRTVNFWGDCNVGATWRAVLKCTIYIRVLDNLSVTSELYELVLSACQFILKIVISPEDESSLLLKHCAVCCVLSDNGKSSDTYQWRFDCHIVVNPFCVWVDHYFANRRLCRLEFITNLMHNFIYSIIILHHDPQHVSSVAVLIFRRTIVYLQYLVSSHTVCCHTVHRWNSIWYRHTLYAAIQSVTIPDTVNIQLSSWRRVQRCSTPVEVHDVILLLNK
jgi:hypothetical protein